MAPYTQMIYCSRRNLTTGSDAAEAEIRSILGAAREHNASDKITGALLLSADCFAQILEGPAEAVERTFERIRIDPRHHDFVALPPRAVTERMFADWSMGFTTTDDTSEKDNAAAVFGRAFARRDEVAATEARELIRESIARCQLW